ncbi:uncharacterized protein [Littorina saxatilis]|uniref:GH10 domain-containing protein n=1 Tax=Littorina saxatilis TaxID=31220 RepID=A0AAN9B657_9CAEN
MFLVSCFLTGLLCLTGGELIQNGGFESSKPDHWECWGCHVYLSSQDSHSGKHSLQANGRDKSYQGPSQYINVTTGQYYHVSAWAKLLNDLAGQDIAIHMQYDYPDGKPEYPEVVRHQNAKTSNGWVHLVGSFPSPSRAPTKARLYFQSGPAAYVGFAVDDVSVVAEDSTGNVTTAQLNLNIDTHRKSNITVHVSTTSGINPADVHVHILQTKKSFPFGTAVSAYQYNRNAAGGKYRDFIHTHFNWAVPENALKWPAIEPQRGHKNYRPALDMIHGLKAHGIKVRGHNLVWSIDRYVQDWIKKLPVTELKPMVKEHIQEVMNVTHGLLEHWDVNNENLHGQWYQTRLDEPDYNLQLFRIANHQDPSVKLFLNDYSVVSQGWSTSDYVIQADKFKNANVGLYGMGVQCHFGNEQKPDMSIIQSRLDTLAAAGLPIWATELDVSAQDENSRADYYEAALRALYAHPAVEGILFWGFWDKSHWRGEKAAMVKGDNLEITAAGRRVLDLLENQWMTDETHALSSSHDPITLRGFHGDYEVHVTYQGKELGNLKQTFILGKADYSVNINVHT